MSELWYNKSIILFFWEGNTMTSISRLVRNQFCAYAPKLKLGKDIIDPRRRPVVPIQHIISLLFCVPLAQKLSMLQIDQWARSERARSLFGSARPIASDSTIQRMLPKIPLVATAHVLRSLLPSTVKQKLLTTPLPGGCSRRLGAIDGSHVAGQWHTVLALIGPKICYPVVFRSMEER